MTLDPHDLVRAYWQTAADRDWPAFGALLHEQVIYEVPQSRERVRGRAAVVEFTETFPGDWTLAVTEVVAEEGKAMSVIAFSLDGETVTGLTLFAIAGGLITGITDWWPSPYEPPARMTALVERY